MRHSTAVALLLVLLIASPVFALGAELDSENQTREYGRIGGFVLAGVAAIVILVGGAHVIKGMIAESARGKKAGLLPEAVLDNTPVKRKVQALYLGEKVPDWKIANRQEATKAALKFLSSKRDWFDRKYIESVVDKAFLNIKTAIERRSSKSIERLVTDECFDEVQAEIKKLRKKGELHMFGRMEITEVQFVHVEATVKKEKQTFTALVSARVRDYLKDEKTDEVLRGDKKTYIYQEFWRFRRAGERWLVERIRQAGDMDRVLDAKNVMNQVDLDKFAKTANPEHLREFVAG